MKKMKCCCYLTYRTRPFFLINNFNYLWLWFCSNILRLIYFFCFFPVLMRMNLLYLKIFVSDHRQDRSIHWYIKIISFTSSLQTLVWYVSNLDRSAVKESSRLLSLGKKELRIPTIVSNLFVVEDSVTIRVILRSNHHDHASHFRDHI